jgi:hypothetical protein
MAFLDPLLGNKTPDVINKETGSWWDTFTDDLSDGIGEVWGGIKDAAGQAFDSWLQDEIGQPSEPERAVESPQAKNADTSGAPPVAFGLTQNQMLLAGAAIVAAIVLVKVAK